MLENKEIDQVLTQMGCWNDDPARVYLVVQWGFSVGIWDRINQLDMSTGHLIGISDTKFSIYSTHLQDIHK